MLPPSPGFSLPLCWVRHSGKPKEKDMHLSVSRTCKTLKISSGNLANLLWRTNEECTSMGFTDSGQLVLPSTHFPSRSSHFAKAPHLHSGQGGFFQTHLATKDLAEGLHWCVDPSAARLEPCRTSGHTVMISCYCWSSRHAKFHGQGFDHGCYTYSVTWE